MSYPKTFLRGLITKEAVSEECYVTSEVFQFQDFRAQRIDNYKELSINWEDTHDAVDVLLNQKKESTVENQFKVGFVRIPLAEVSRFLKVHISDNSFSYERNPIEGNLYHGNPLTDANLSKQIVKNIQHSLATLATSSEVYLRSDAEVPYINEEKNNMPKVSVIVPVYGVEKYIERCARSLFEQTLDDIEYLFIDDCTPDKSIEVLKQVLEDYPQRKSQVIIHRMEQNSGQAIVRKWGMLNATGDYVIHCDSDDWVDKDMYRMMYNVALNNLSDVVICDYVVTDGKAYNEIVKGCHSSTIKELLSNSLFQIDPWSLWNKLFKRELSYNLEYPTGAMGEDMLLVIQQLITCKKFSYVPKVLYFYNSNPNSITKAKSIDAIIYRFNQAKENVDKLILLFLKNGLYTNYKFEINYVKFTVLRLIQPALKDKRCYGLWRTTYPNMGIRFLLNPRASLKDKLKFVLSSIKLYPNV